MEKFIKYNSNNMNKERISRKIIILSISKEIFGNIIF